MIVQMTEYEQDPSYLRLRYLSKDMTEEMTKWVGTADPNEEKNLRWLVKRAGGFVMNPVYIFNRTTVAIDIECPDTTVTGSLEAEEEQDRLEAAAYGEAEDEVS
jgi:hypothetical protein